jgi:predicted DNA-binding transcriptional regulator YafY
MKLYNLFQEVILEGISEQKRLLTEAVSIDDVKACIDGKYNVNIQYMDIGETVPSKRYIQVYALGKSKTGNDIIRAYQITGASREGNKNGFWKTFRLDRITGWFPTKVKWASPISDFDPTIPKYNPNGDGSMSSVMYKVNLAQKPQQTQTKTV